MFRLEERRFTEGVFLLGLLLLSLTVTVTAKAESITIQKAWIRAMPPVTTVTAAYMTIHNSAENTDRILSITSPVAGKVEIHKSVVHEGMMKMMHAGNVEIPARGKIELNPQGYHFMLMNLTRVPQAGDIVEVAIHFEHAGELKLNLPVKRSMGNGMSH